MHDFFRFSEMLKMTFVPSRYCHRGDLSAWEALFQRLLTQLPRPFPSPFGGLLCNNPARSSSSLKMSSGLRTGTSQWKGKGFALLGN